MITHPIHPISIKCWADFLEETKRIFVWLLHRCLGGAEVDHTSECMSRHFSNKTALKADEPQPMPLAFLWLSRRRTFYNSLVFPYQVLLRSTLFNTLHTGLVLTTCQQIRWWLLLSFQLLLTTLSLVEISPKTETLHTMETVRAIPCESSKAGEFHW